MISSKYSTRLVLLLGSHSIPLKIQGFLLIKTRSRVAAGAKVLEDPPPLFQIAEKVVCFSEPIFGLLSRVSLLEDLLERKPH